MAETTDNSNKIDCRSRRAVKIISEKLYDCVTASLQDDESRNPEDRSRYLNKFKEVFERVSQQNIVVNGDDCEAKAENTTPEYEPVDREKEAHINEDLLSHLDDCVVKVAKKRKRLPHVCHKAITDFANHQAAYMSKVKPQAEHHDIDGPISEASRVKSVVDCQRLQRPCDSLSLLSKEAPKDQERAVHLSKAVEIEIANRQCETPITNNSHSPSVNNSQPSCTKCITKRRLDVDAFNDFSSVSKMSRFNAMSAQDFSVVSPSPIT